MPRRAAFIFSIGETFGLRPRRDDDPKAMSARFMRSVDEFAPALIAVTSMYSNSLQAMRMIRTAKRHFPSIAMIAGGSHFGAMGVESLRRIDELDFVVEGEGENAVLALLNTLEHGGHWSDVPSLCYRDGTKICKNQPHALIDLSELPPIWSNLAETIDLSRYSTTVSENAFSRAVYLEAGRGCPFSCVFCATAPFWRRKYRVKPTERIVDEIRCLHEVYGYNRFNLIHDLLTADLKFISDFCDAMIAAKLPVEWMANSRTDIPLRGLLPKMKAAGCRSLFMGVESGSPRVQRAISKRLDLKEVYETIEKLTHNGITATCSFVLGFPDETAEEIASSINLGVRLKLFGVENIQFHRLRLWPPAPLTTEPNQAQFDLDALRIEYPFLHVSRDDIDLIRQDSKLFGGYFVPESLGATPSELAQIEMFFHHAVALAPLTMAALAQVLNGRLIELFCAALSECGPIQRETLDWEDGRFYGNWLAITPITEAMLGLTQVETNQAELASELFLYEKRRIEFIAGVWQQIDPPPLASGDHWAAYRMKIDVPAAIEAVRAGLPPSPKLFFPSIVVFAEQDQHSFGVFVIDEVLLPRLVQGDAVIVRQFLGLSAEPQVVQGI